MSDVQALFAERSQLRADLMAHKVPKRVPVYPSFTLEAACSHAGVDLMQAHYRPDLREQAFESICRDFYADCCPALDLRFPASYQILGARNWILGSNGAVQHPEIETMTTDDYDDFIAAPYATIVEKLLPRVCTALDTAPMNAATTLAAAYDAYAKAAGVSFGLIGKLSAKYGYSFGIIGGANMIEAPFDFLADQLRGYKGINMDVRRCPDKVKAACDALVPLMVKQGTPTHHIPGTLDFIPLHLAPYISRKAFDELYWPTLLECIVQLDRKGIGCSLYAEEDWTRYLDALLQLPESTVVFFENGDYKKIKNEFGKNHIIAGFFDPTITLSRSREACIDEVKRLCDACMEGGHFYFTFDRGVMDAKSVDASKLAAVLEWVRDNAVY